MRSVSLAIVSVSIILIAATARRPVGRSTRCWCGFGDFKGSVGRAPHSEKGNALCLSCHNKQNATGLKEGVSEHTHHAKDSPGSGCVACHMPRAELTIKDIYVAAAPSV